MIYLEKIQIMNGRSGGKNTDIVGFGCSFVDVKLYFVLYFASFLEIKFMISSN